jgi:ATP/maltotriose-dependent transcriptional regulator MalT
MLIGEQISLSRLLEHGCEESVGLQHDPAGMAREAAGLMGKPGEEDIMLDTESDTAAYGGQFSKARELTQRASESAREALVGNTSQAKQQAQASLALSNGKDAEAMSAVALGLAGDATQARRVADDLSKRFPEDPIVQFEYLPMIHSIVTLQEGNTTTALEALGPAVPYEFGAINQVGFALYPIYLRGEAYLAARQGGAAATEFQKIIDRPDVVQNEPIGALSHLGLARAYAMQGGTAKARSAYQDFFALWKDADPDISILKEAKAEYAKLQ